MTDQERFSQDAPTISEGDVQEQPIETDLEKHHRIIALLLLLVAVLFGAVYFYYTTNNWFGDPEIPVVTPSQEDLVLLNEKGGVDDALSLAHKGSLEFKEKEYGQQAVVIFENTLKNDPNNMQALLGIGYAYEIMEEYEKSLAYYNQALALDPNSAIVYNRIGHMYDLSEGMEKAEPFYRKALEIDSQYIDAKINVARVYLRQNKGEDAIGILKEVYMSQDLNGRARAEVAYLLFADVFDNGNYEQAKIYIEEAKSSDPTLPMVWVGMGMSKLYEIQKLPSADGAIQLYEESLGYFDKASKLYEYQTAAYYWKGRAVILTGDYANAASLFRTAKEVVRKDITLMQEQRSSFEEEIDTYLAEAEQKTTKETSFLKNIFIKTANAAACCSYWGWKNGVWTNHNSCVEWCTTQAQENQIYLQLVAGTGAHSARISGNTVVCVNGASATYVPINEPTPSPTPTPTPTYSCGALPAGATMCTGDNSGLTSDGNWTNVGTTPTSCSTLKCEYYVSQPLSVKIMGEDTVSLGHSIRWTAEASNGMPPYHSWAWTGAASGSGTNLTVARNFIDARIGDVGPATVYVTVYDSSTPSQSASDTFTTDIVENRRPQ